MWIAHFILWRLRFSFFCLETGLVNFYGQGQLIVTVRVLTGAMLMVISVFLVFFFVLAKKSQDSAKFILPAERELIS